MFQNKLFQISTIVALIVIVAGTLLWAWFGARSAAQSKTILENASIIAQGIDYFFEDQNRYPSTVEFVDTNLMNDYLSNFPAQEYIGGECTESYRYKNPNPDEYTLEVCLPNGIDGYVAGWNTFLITR